jgi:hypothetical protein
MDPLCRCSSDPGKDRTPRFAAQERLHHVVKSVVLGSKPARRPHLHFLLAFEDPEGRLREIASAPPME